VIARLAAAVAARRGLRRYGLAFILGVLAAGGLEPLSLFPLLLIAFTGLVWLLDGATEGRARFIIGWLFGFGFFVAGLHWIAFPLLVDASRFAWMIPFALVLLPGGFGLLIGAATWTATRIVPEGGSRVLALAVAWAAAEWIRGHVFTGFPWNLVGYTWIDVAPVLPAAGLMGVYGLSLLTVFAAAAPAALARGRSAQRTAAPAVGALVIFGALGVYGALQHVLTPTGEE